MGIPCLMAWLGKASVMSDMLSSVLNDVKVGAMCMFGTKAFRAEEAGAAQV